VNPRYVAESEEKIVWGSVLEFLVVFMQVEPTGGSRCGYQDWRGRRVKFRWRSEEHLELLQHEIDHLDGILAVDRITDIKTMCTRENSSRDTGGCRSMWCRRLKRLQRSKDAKEVRSEEGTFGEFETAGGSERGL